jgi:CO/xanthine dehydrogenase FAD-binding subunit
VAIGGSGRGFSGSSPIEDLLRSSHSIPDSETLLAMLQETARPVDDIRGSKTFKFLMAAELIRTP